MAEQIKTIFADLRTKVSLWSTETSERMDGIKLVAFLRAKNPDIKVLNIGCGGTNWGTTNADITERDVENFVLIPTKCQYSFWRDNEFDLCTCFHVIEHVPEIVDFLREIKRISRYQVILYPKENSMAARLPHHKWIVKSHDPLDFYANPEYDQNYQQGEYGAQWNFEQRFYRQFFEYYFNHYKRVLG